MKKNRVLIGSPIKQKSNILKEFLISLSDLNKEGLEVGYLFVDDNEEEKSSELLKEFSVKQPNVTIYKHTSEDEYIRNHTTHFWNEQLIWKVANLKNMMIQIAKEFNYDYLFLIDSDIVLNPITAKHLISLKKDIVSEVFWTKWQPNYPALPQVWLTDQYNLFRKHRNEQIDQDELIRRETSFIEQMKIPGVHEVGGLGACTMISRSALEMGVNFNEIKNVSFWGEDRHFCIRAAALGISLFVDTQYPAYHIYREEDLQGVSAFKDDIFFKNIYDVVQTGIERLGSFHYQNGYHPEWKESFTIEFGELLEKQMEEENNSNIHEQIVVKASIDDFSIVHKGMQEKVIYVNFELINDGNKLKKNFRDVFKAEAILIFENKKWLIDKIDIVG